MKAFKILAVLLIITAITASVTAQVTIGADDAPQNFSVLELISNNERGLRLPQLTTQQRDDLQATFGSKSTAEAMGLQIFNTKTKCVETWNGADWIQQCQMCGGVPCLFITPPAHYDPTCAGNIRCADLDGFMVSPLADSDLVFDGTKNAALAAAGAAFKMKPVTGGVFYMGSQNNSSSQPNYGTDAVVTPVHQTGISSFYMGETEVTQGLWDAVMGSHNSWTATNGVSANHPTYNESWYAAIAFCNKLSLLLNRTPVYSVKVGGVEVDWANLAYSSIPTASNANWNAASMNASANGFRLPTEAEWEYASRGGQKNEYTRTLGVSGVQYLYSGSNTVNNVAAYRDGSTYYNQSAANGGDGTSSIYVKSLQANDLGLYDMSGNVWEWCWDRYDSYQTCCDERDPRGAATGSDRVYRGGGWGNSSDGCRVSYRNYDNPFYHFNGLGFRVVLVP